MAVAAPRGRADGDEHDVGGIHRLGELVVKNRRFPRTFLATSSARPGS